ncbi:hypothetical protein GT755_10240 [Herbidospora sp. NEAU-GS84]|uniref:DUF3105 domain-containing protein n=1 Tax=Herbidospora solisilvae TaxID=2696284 RepID=A0A7C9J1R2_9ACTN|nr:hypothetical protein [Herbidospora solisilvae]NAS22062.1 hypothetical protein [Herbidospora solisilvae]
MLRRLMTPVAALVLCAACGAPADPTADSPPGAVTCESGPRTSLAGPGDTEWRHPDRSFYAPADPDVPTGGSLEHLIVRDNALIVQYSRELPQPSIDEIRDWAAMQTATVAVPGPADPVIRATLASTELTCDGLDLNQLTELARSRTPGEVADHGDQ